MDAAEAKLAAARTKLILDKPFLGALVLRLPLVAAKSHWCPTTATDARSFYYNPEYIDSLSTSQAQFMLSHEALHCALSHFARRTHRVKRRWDLACDFAINPLLLEDGLTPPPDARVLDAYKGMTAEEIYPLIDESTDMQTLDQHVYDQEQHVGTGNDRSRPPQHSDKTRPDEPQPSGDLIQDRDQDRAQGEPQPKPQEADPGAATPAQMQPQDNDEPSTHTHQVLADAPTPLTPDERETLQVQWQQRLAGAAQQALQAGKIGDSLARIIGHLLQPQLPWRMLVARYVTASARDDFSFMRPSRREGDAIRPSLRSSQIDLVVAVDTSGSIKPAEIDEFLSEISAIKGQIRARVTLLACDAKIVEGAPWIYEPWDEIKLPETLAGGGGTDFRPVFDWVDRAGVRPDMLVYFTDAEGPFPANEPNFPVLWLVKGKETTPWGQRVQLN